MSERTRDGVADEATGLAPGTAVIVNPGGEGNGARAVYHGVVDAVDGSLVDLTCPDPGAATLEIGRAVELAPVRSGVVLTATVVGIGGTARTVAPTTRTSILQPSPGGSVLSLAVGGPISGHEQRAWTRLHLAIPVCASTSAPPGFQNFVGRTRDVSVGGTAFHSFAPVPVGPAVVVLHIDGALRVPRLSRTLEVARPADGSRGWIARVHFVASDQASVEVMGAFIARAILEERTSEPEARSGTDEMAHFLAVTRRGRLEQYRWQHGQERGGQ